VEAEMVAEAKVLKVMIVEQCQQALVSFCLQQRIAMEVSFYHG
jgi:hypothetical protein